MISLPSMFRISSYKLPKVDNHKVDLSSLDSTFELLRSTAHDVSFLASEVSQKLEDRLRDTENRLFSIIDSIEDFILVKDGDGKWRTLNKFGQSLYGWNNFEFLGKSDEELIKLYPEYTVNLIACTISDERAWKSKGISRTEEYFMVGDSVQYFDVIKTPVFNEDGSRKELIIVGRNITKLKEDQRRIKACFNALNASSDVVVICDNKEQIIFSNDKFLKKFGFDNYSDVLGKKLNIVFSDNNDKMLYNSIWSVIRSNKIWNGDLVSKTVAGEEVHCKLSILPVMNGVPEPIYYICTMKYA